MTKTGTETRKGKGTGKEIVKMVLLTAGAIGGIGAVCVFPGLAYLVPSSYRRRYPQTSIKQAVLRLDKRGLIVARQIPGGRWKIHLTKNGYAEFLAYDLGRKGIAKPRRWDKKWRLLIFDIPEKRRSIRDRVRRFLRSLGFYRLQDSVWVHPYECREVLDLLRAKYQVRSEALYVGAYEIDNDRWLQKHFKLID